MKSASIYNKMGTYKIENSCLMRDKSLIQKDLMSIKTFINIVHTVYDM